jgi:Zn-dependent protease with chaperone function
MSDNRNPTDTNRVRFPGLEIGAFQHPLDRQATENLKRLAGFDTVVAKFIELRYERLFYVFNLANTVRVGPKQFPRLYNMLQECCAILDVAEPELYVFQTPLVNAYTFGHNNPHIVMFTGLMDLMTDDEMMAVVAHELGHIKCGHVLYNTMANSIRDITAIISQLTLGIGGLVLAGIEAALIQWRRRAELSADRAGLLAVQNPMTTISVLMKLAGGSHRLVDELDPEQFLEQARHYTEEMDKGMVERFYRLIADLYQGNHPFAVERAKELDEWANSAAYQRILSGDYQDPNRRVQIRVSRT